MTDERPASEPSAATAAAPPYSIRIPTDEAARGRAGVLLMAAGIVTVVLTQFAVTREWGPSNAGYGYLIGVVLTWAGAYLLPKGNDSPLVLPRGLELWLLGGIVLLAAILRVWDVWDFPPGLWYDEVFYGVDAKHILYEDHYVVWSTTINGRATLFMYILAGIFKVFGVSEMTMRALPIAIGVITVGAFYLLARELMSQLPALLATFLLAVSRWQITFSRIVWEASMMPLMVILSLYFLLKALRTGRWYYYVACGVSVGAGLYTYLAFRLVPIALAVLVLYIAWREWPLIRNSIVNLIMAGAVAVLVFLPLGHYAYTHQDQFLHRASQVNLCDESDVDCERVVGSAVFGLGGIVLGLSAVEQRRRWPAAALAGAGLGSVALLGVAFVLLDSAGNIDPLVGVVNGEEGNVRKVAKMFNIAGDRNGRHNIPGEPMLDPISAALLVVGAGLSLWGWRTWRRGSMLLLAVVLAAPSVFTLTSENPSAIRALGTVAPVFLLTGFAFEPLASQGARWAGRWWVIGPAVAALAMTAATINTYDFFERQANETVVFRDFHPEFTLAARLASSETDDHNVIMSASFVQDPVMLLLADGTPVQTFTSGGDVPYRQAPDKDILFILDPKDSESLAVLQSYYPDGVASELRDPGGGLIYSTFEVTRQMVVDGLGLENHIYAGDDVSGQPIESSRIESPSIDWSQESAPTDVPFTMVWEGTLFIDAYAPHSFQVVSPGAVALELDGSLLGDGEREVSVQTEALAVGPHSLRVTLGVEALEGVSELRWLAPGSAGFAVVPSQTLFSRDIGERGFITRYFSGGAGEVPTLVARQVVLGPVPLVTSPYTADLIGEMTIEEPGTYGLALEGNQETLIFIDGALALDRGPASSGRVEAQLTLDEGKHDLVVRYNDPVGDADWRIEWRPPGQEEFGAPPLDIFTVPPGGIEALPTEPVISTIDLDADWGQQGRQLEGLETAHGLALGQDGALYVLESDGEVRVFDADGTPLRDWSTGIAEAGDIAVGPDGAVYVLGADDHLLRFQPDGTPNGEVEGEFQSARGIATGPDGTLYVAHASLSAILVIQPDGTLRNTILPPPAPDGTQFLQPTDVVRSAEGLIFSVTAEQPSIWRFTADGTFGLRWTFSPNLSNAGSHLAFSDGRVIASDPEGGRVLAYDANGRLIASGQLPPGPTGERPRPVGMAASGDVIWTADLLTGRVFKLNVSTPEESEQ